MHIIKKMIIALIVFLPSASWSADLHYALDVQINTKNKKIIGNARFKTEADKKLGLSVSNLRNLKVNGNAVNITADENIILTVQSGKEIFLSYEAIIADNETNFIDKDNVFLNQGWYPQPDALVEYELSVTLPKNFIATSEAESVTIQEHEKTKTFYFQFNHPLDTLHLAASNKYVLKKEYYNNIAVEAYFFKEDVKLADVYISHTKKYLEMYETMLAPYPYKRFAIVENILPTGNSMPTFTLLGKRVVNLPFIVKTSLGHEILHEWFGNSVYIDFAHGNWAEGLTTYLADHHYASLEDKGAAYRKQIMVDYSAYINSSNAMPVSDFFTRRNKAQSVIGYGKTAMLFHGLRQRYGGNVMEIKNFLAPYKNLSNKIAFVWHPGTIFNALLKK
jgi:aminopeptidase N